MFTFITHIEKKSILQDNKKSFCHELASILPYEFPVGLYAFLVRSYTFFRPWITLIRNCARDRASHTITKLMLPIVGGLVGREMYEFKSEKPRFILVLHISFQITEQRAKSFFTTSLFILFCSRYFNGIINEFLFFTLY